MNDKSGKLEGRVAIVTGGGGGIGRATALCLASHGASVVAADLNGDAAQATAEAVHEQGGQAIPVVVDVGSEASIAEMVERAIAEFGRLDILHNNAAALGAELLRGDAGIDVMDLDVWNTTMQINLAGPMLSSKHSIPHMIRGGGGSIINTSSGAAFVGDLRLTAYAASKGALNTLTIYTAMQFGKQGIRCNAIAPGLIVSPALVKDDEAYVARLKGHMTPRLGQPEDIANTVAFLASDESAFLTGQVLRVDGGYIARSPWVGLTALR